MVYWFSLNTRNDVLKRRGDPVNEVVASVGYAIYRECSQEPSRDRVLNAFLFLTDRALTRCPPELRGELETELLSVAERLGLMDAMPEDPFRR